MPDLTLAEVKVRLKSYSDPAVTDELYSSGQSLVTNAADRMARLDSKGFALAAYAGGILTALLSTYVLWGKLLSGWFFPTVAELGILAVAISAWLAVRSVHPQQISGTRKTVGWRVNVLRIAKSSAATECSQCGKFWILTSLPSKSRTKE